MEENTNFSTEVEINFESKEENSNSSGEIFNYTNFTATKEEKEKRQIKKSAVITCLPFIITYILTRVVSFGLSYLLKYLSNIGVDTTPFSSSEVKDTIQILFSIFLFTVPFIIPLKSSKKTVSETVPFVKPIEKGLVLPFFLIGISFCEFANIAVSYAGSIFESFGVDYSVNYGNQGSSFIGVVLTFFATAIVPGLIEEFALRGIVLGTLLPYGEGFACMTSAILFGVMHGNFEQMPFAFLVGLVLGIIRIKTGTMWVCMLVHFANNFISLLLDYAPSNMSSDLKNILYSIFLAIGLLLGVIGVMLLCKRNNYKEIFSLSKGEFECGEIKKYKWFFVSTAGIIFIALYVYRSFRYIII